MMRRNGAEPHFKYFPPRHVEFAAIVTCAPSSFFHIHRMSMITATSWVPRGFAAPFPKKYVFDEDEYARISKLAKLQLDDAKEDLEEAQEEKKETKTGKSTAGTSGNAEGVKDTECDWRDITWTSYANFTQRHRR